MIRVTITRIIYICLLLSVLGSSTRGQDLIVKEQSGIYANNNFVSSMTQEQALLLYEVRPNGNITSASIVTYDQIVGRSFDPSFYSLSRSFGRLHVDADNGVQYVMGLIDSKYYYASSGTSALESVILPPLNAQLRAKNLGMEKQRSIFISMLNQVGFDIKPLNFSGLLRPWILAGLVIFLAIPMWYLVKRFLR